MRIFRLLCLTALSSLLVSRCWSVDHQAAAISSPRTFTVKGVLKELKADGTTAIIQHEAVSNYMAAMTMPFKARNPAELAGLHLGDEISFRLLVTEDESWIERISRTGNKAPIKSTVTAPSPNSPATNHHPLLDYKFTNELG